MLVCTGTSTCTGIRVGSRAGSRAGSLTTCPSYATGATCTVLRAGTTYGFAISREDTEANDNIEITHVHLNDNTVAGIRIKNKNVFSVQYHPEASPGPNDSQYLFDQFMENIIKSKKAIV